MVNLNDLETPEPVGIVKYLLDLTLNTFKEKCHELCSRNYKERQRAVELFRWEIEDFLRLHGLPDTSKMNDTDLPDDAGWYLLWPAYFLPHVVYMYGNGWLSVPTMGKLEFTRPTDEHDRKNRWLRLD